MLDVSEEEIIPTRITTATSKSMTVVGNYLYFSNSQDGGKLYAVPVIGENITPLRVYDYKVSELINDGKRIFFGRSTFAYEYLDPPPKPPKPPYPIGPIKIFLLVFFSQKVLIYHVF